MNSFLTAPQAKRSIFLAVVVMFLFFGSSWMQAQTVPVSPAGQTKAVNAANVNQTVLNETDQYRLSPIVVKFGALLGMQPETAANVFTIFNILILVGGVGYGLMKVLPGTFRKRSTEIQRHLVDARTATEEATARLSSVEDRLAKLDHQIDAMRAQSEADGKRDEARIHAAVEDEKIKIIEAAEAEIQSATTLARRDLQRYAAELAIEQAARKLDISAETDRLLVEGFAHRLGEGSSN
jgi:F-type H+-transporting ATPase subunit b